MTSDKKEIAKILTISILGEDYREAPKSKFKSFWRRIKKCLPGY